MKKEIISVVIPCFNSREVIKRSVDSVLNQTYKDIEVLVIDDASEDDTLDILENYKDQRLKVLSLPFNTGSPVIPRNTGILKSVGKYVAFLDSDDYWASNKLEAQIEQMQLNASSFSCTSYIVKDLNGFSHKRKVPLVSSYSDTLALNKIGCSTVMIDRELVSNYLFSDRRLEDYDLWLRILKDGNTILGVDEYLMTYIKSNNSRSTFNLAQLTAYLNLFKRFEKLNTLQALAHCLSYLIRRLVWSKI
ncbi:glycosyltransferase family 2 protein [Vibrio breoganii]